MAAKLEISNDLFDQWANDIQLGAVALTLRQKLLPVECGDPVIFPPTYARIGYNIDTLSDGRKVATIDSVGAQANRMEPMFKAPSAGLAEENTLASLVPQVYIEYGDGKSISLLDAGHRLADAIVRSSDRLGDGAGQSEHLHQLASSAFAAHVERGDASLIARLAPTSLVFGAWDSRGTSDKLPRTVQSVIRAWDVSPLKRSAQYNPPIDYVGDAGAFSQSDVKKAGAVNDEQTKNKFAKAGFLHVPATNQLGGIVVHGDIRRDVTVNLIALRRLQGSDHHSGTALRRYVLGLSLAVVAEPMDGFLRSGCLLTEDPNTPNAWSFVSRNGARQSVLVDRQRVFELARQAAQDFFGENGVPSDKTFQFNKERARTLVNEAAKSAAGNED